MIGMPFIAEVTEHDLLIIFNRRCSSQVPIFCSIITANRATMTMIASTLCTPAGLIMSTDGHLPIQSHQEGTIDPTMVNLNETLRDVEELKKGNSSATMEQRVGNNLGDFNSPHHQRPFDNVSNYGFHDILVQNSHPFYRSEYQGRPQAKDGRKGEEKGRFTNPTRCFKSNGEGQIAINCSTKRPLVFSEDLNGWIEKGDDDCKETKQRSKFEKKLAKYLVKHTLPPTVGPTLPLPVPSGRENDEKKWKRAKTMKRSRRQQNSQPTARGRMSYHRRLGQLAKAVESNLNSILESMKGIPMISWKPDRHQC
ncbi:hypothetical protein M9H77_29786 [Catharanthus roseus]|uniref:Uncharacterized protein n=1 Tax=Catharanthus roseus TaxID=4058 RepID=A0ACB9ZVR6_CATRO|nr:hypothetical protein M9H77_29786 [Catharanthus roseus]